MSESPGAFRGRELAATWIDEEAWGRAVDPDVPPGVIALCDTNGEWWRYPLAEFPAEDAQAWTAEAEVPRDDH